MKKILVLVLSFFVLSDFCFSKENEVTEKSLYNQVVYAFNNGIYDSSIQFINQLAQKFPSSELLSECEFIKGQCFYYQKKYNQALECFYKVSQNAENHYYNESILYAARCYFLVQEFEKAITLYEFIISNGNNYTKNDYVESLKKLFICYNNTGNKKKTEKLLSKFNEDDFGAETYKELLEINDSVLAEYYLAKKLLENGELKESFEVLQRIESKVKSSDNQNLQDSYFALLIRYFAMTENWKEILPAFDKIVQKNDNAIYFAALANFNLSKYDSVIKLLENKSYLQDLYKISLAIESFYQKDYGKSLKISQSVKNDYADYLSGLNCINLKNWKKAISYFDSFLKKNPNDEYLAMFYKGYAEFSINLCENSLASFEDYLNNVNRKKIINSKYENLAYQYSIRNAINLQNKEKVVEFSEKLLELTKDYNEKVKMAIFVAEIYSDFADYQKAINVLQPYTKDFSEKNMNAIFSLANLYENNKEYSKAHSVYTSIYTKFPKNEYAPQALFQQAHLYYSLKEYDKAEDCFYNFIYKFPNDENLPAAMYYCSDCYLKNGKKQNALMMCNTIVKSYPDCTYEYASYKNLVFILYDLQDYGAALETANLLIKKYPEQVVSDGIVEKQKELNKIVSGTDKEIAKKYAEYTKVGNSSVKGRILGTELVALYMKNNSESQEAFNLANELVKLQTSDSETYYKAQNYENLAHYYKNKSDYKKAADMFLQATEFYRVTDKIKPAETLYLGTECFNLAGMLSDAEETAQLLINLYPNTDYAKNVKKIQKNR